MVREPGTRPPACDGHLCSQATFDELIAEHSAPPSLSRGASPGPFLGWSHERFVAFCVACGCDYVENIPGVGPARALVLCTERETPELILDALLAEPGCPADYEEKFQVAMDIFRRNE